MGWGAFALPQFLADKLTLLQPGGQIIPTTLLIDPPVLDNAWRLWITFHVFYDELFSHLLKVGGKH